MTNNVQPPGGNTTTAGAVERLAEYLIRKGGAYYRPNAAGYTNNIAEAGRYSLDDAIRHSHPNGPNGPRDGIDYMPAPTFPSEAEWRAQSEDERYQFLKSLYAQAHSLPGDVGTQIEYLRDALAGIAAHASPNVGGTDAEKLRSATGSAQLALDYFGELFPAALTPSAGETRLVRAGREAIELIDELNERATSRKFWGISQTMHNKLCTIRVTLARALPSHQGAGE